MTEKQWQEIGGVADQEYVDFIRGYPDINGWIEYVKELEYITEEEVEEIGGWEQVFWMACEWA